MKRLIAYSDPVFKRREMEIYVISGFKYDINEKSLSTNASYIIQILNSNIFRYIHGF